MSIDNSLISLTWDVIKDFIKDWQDKPYRWGYEGEIQAEIYGRLNTAYKRIRKDTFRGNYGSYCNIESLRNNQILNRVGCEVRLEYKGKSRAPDLVIWGEGDPSQNNMREDWPILLVCEIKVISRKKDGVTNRKNILVDREKIEYWLEKRARYGCLLIFYYQVSKENYSCDCPLEGKIRRIDIKIPTKEKK